MKRFSIFIFFFCSPIFIFSQSGLDPIFSPFNGKAYELPRKKYNFKYHPRYEKQTPIAEFVWDDLILPETSTKFNFPDVNRKNLFAVIFTSTMKIKVEGWYNFSLFSDDGSILWIDKKMVVNNDGTHKMTLKQDSIALSPGIYPIKVWYYQAYPDRYGLEFHASYFRKLVPDEKTANTKTIPSKNVKMIIPNQILNFDYDSHEIDATAKIFLDSISNKILTFENISKIIISGHTDNVGNDKYNAELSVKRATTIQKELEQRLQQNQIKYEVKGFGESKPIGQNSSSEGRAKNRRVEVEIIFSNK